MCLEYKTGLHWTVHKVPISPLYRFFFAAMTLKMLKLFYQRTEATDRDYVNSINATVKTSSFIEPTFFQILSILR